MLQLSFVKFKSGAYISVEGRPCSDQFFIIQSGKVSSSFSANQEAKTILGPGDFIGVISCMASSPQTETAIALMDTVCILVRKDQYPDLIQQNTPIAIKIIKAFAAKMRTLNDVLMSFTSNSANAAQDSDNPEQIFSVASHYDKVKFYDIAFYAYYQYLKAAPNGENVETAKNRLVQLKASCRAPHLGEETESILQYPKNTMVFSENQAGRELFIIQEGTVKISKVVNGEEVTLALLKKGDIFGEIALLENKGRSANAIAFEDCSLLVVTRKNFELMVQTQAQLISRLTMTLANRLWSLYRQLSNAVIVDPLAKLLDMILIRIENAHVPISKYTSFNTNFSVRDLSNMCGFSEDKFAQTQSLLGSCSCVRMMEKDIYIPDTLELQKVAAAFKKKSELGI